MGFLLVWYETLNEQIQMSINKNKRFMGKVEQAHPFYLAQIARRR
jgi:hypothetical protein